MDEETVTSSGSTLNAWAARSHRCLALPGWLSSAWSATLPLAICSPPANRNIVETSAMTLDSMRDRMWESSSFASCVSAGMNIVIVFRVL